MTFDPAAKGSASRVVVDWEDSFGTPKSTGKAGKIIGFNSCSLKLEQALNVSNELRGNRNPAQPFVGNRKATGELVVPVRSDAFGFLLKAMCNKVVDAGTTGAYTHTYTIDKTASCPSFVIEKGYLDLSTPYYELFKGCKIAKMSLTVGGDGELLATFSIIAQDMTSGTTAYDSSASALSGWKFQMFDAAAKEGGSAINYLKEFKLDFDNDLDDSVYCIGGGGVLADLPEGIVKVTGSINAIFNGTSLLNKATGTTESSLEIEFNPADSTDNLKITLPEIVYSRTSAAIPSPKGLLLDMNYSAYWANDAGNSAITIVLQNSTETH